MKMVAQFILVSMSAHTLALSSTQRQAIQVFEEQRQSGLPLDIVLRRYVKTNALFGDERDKVSSAIFGVARHQARLDWRLSSAGFECSPTNRVVADLYLRKLSPVQSLSEEFGPLVDALGPPILEVPEMDRRAALECPEWAWEPFLAAFGAAAAETELRALQRPAPLDLRVNTLKARSPAAALAAIRDAGFDAAPTPFSPLGVRLAKRAALGRVPGLLAGMVEPMDEGSQLLAALVEAAPGESVVDFCAGSGGKTLALAAQMSNKGTLWAMDVDEGRLARGRARYTKAGADNVRTHLIDGGGGGGGPVKRDKWLKRKKRSFDRVLVDAPCSGVGSWRRKPDARWAPQQPGKTLEALAPLQAEILARASRLVKPGGRLVYATCSMLPEENEDQVVRFLETTEEGKDWKLTPPSSFCVPFDRGFLRLSPEKHGTDGFFAAVLTRDI